MEKVVPIKRFGTQISVLESELQKWCGIYLLGFFKERPINILVLDMAKWETSQMLMIKDENLAFGVHE